MFLGDILCPLTKPMVPYCKNQPAITVTENDQYHACMKHINIQDHFIWESISREIIEICYCPTENMVVDIFMKALPVKTFEHLRTLPGVHLDWGGVLLFTVQTHIQWCQRSQAGSGSFKDWPLKASAYMHRNLSNLNVVTLGLVVIPS